MLAVGLGGGDEAQQLVVVLPAHRHDVGERGLAGAVGSSLDALEAGHRPVLLPGPAARGEHVDDHQEAVARELVRRDLAVMAEAPEVHEQHLLDAAGEAPRGSRPHLAPCTPGWSPRAPDAWRLHLTAASRERCLPAQVSDKSMRVPSQALTDIPP